MRKVYWHILPACLGCGVGPGEVCRGASKLPCGIRLRVERKKTKRIPKSYKLIRGARKFADCSWCGVRAGKRCELPSGLARPPHARRKPIKRWIRHIPLPLPFKP